mmetsp:Transcript_26792/g.50766  ORF Transcript_26792/g.50766 Transcript_26792/m.50766 type:complete len:463 (+) Transcript_26792:31-1419(+)
MQFFQSAILLALAASSHCLAPRNVRVKDKTFVTQPSGSTSEVIMLEGPNVVVKGPPYLPGVDGDSQCSDLVDAECQAAGTCETCYTFNEADVNHIKSLGYNSIRLGVVWAGAQPTEGDSLDPAFMKRLHDILDLTDRTGIHVILDNHGDMVGSAGCGNGVPMWFQQKAAPDLIGKKLTTGFPYSLISSLKVTNVNGYDHCTTDEQWAAHAGDPNYNLLNECCQAMNSPNPGGLGYTKISQKTMDYMVNPGEGRDYFVKFWKLMAEAVVDHPSAIAAELMNEPMTIYRKHAFNTWRAAAETINAVIPDMAVAVCDTGEGSFIPDWVTKYYPFGDLRIDRDTEKYMKESQNLFYAWHYYGQPSTPDEAVKNAQAISDDWNMPSFATEFMGCSTWNAAKNAGISHSYWHYSCYCDTNADAFSAKGVVVPDTSFGACILGWGGGNADYTCDEEKVKDLEFLASAEA